MEEIQSYLEKTWKTKLMSGKEGAVMVQRGILEHVYEPGDPKLEEQLDKYRDVLREGAYDMSGFGIRFAGYYPNESTPEGTFLTKHTRKSGKVDWYLDHNDGSWVSQVRPVTEEEVRTFFRDRGEPYPGEEE